MALSISEVVATTLFLQSEDTADTIMNSIPVLQAIQKKGLVEKVNGGYEYRMPVEFASATGQWFSGAEQLNTATPDIYTAFVYDRKMCGVPCTITGSERRANGGDKALIKLVSGKIDNAKKALKNLIETSLHSDGSGTAGKELTGFGAHLGATQSSGTIGGVDRATYSWAQASTYAFSTTLGETWSVANIQRGLLAAMIPAIRGTDKPDLALATKTPWQHLHNSFTAIQRITSESDSAKGGFVKLSFMGCDFILDGGYGITESTPYVRILNTDYWKMFGHEDLWFSALGEQRTPIDQDLTVQFVGLEGNLGCNGFPFQVYVGA